MLLSPTLRKGMTMLRVIPRDLVGLPITEERASELAIIVVEQLDDSEGLDALMELLLGIAPPKGGAFDEADLWARYMALMHAFDSLYQYTDEHAEALERYALKYQPRYSAKQIREDLEPFAESSKMSRAVSRKHRSKP